MSGNRPGCRENEDRSNKKKTDGENFEERKTFFSMGLPKFLNGLLEQI
jgi:hypothetical protein